MKLSVLLVTSGRETLERTIESILAQNVLRDEQTETLLVGKGEDLARKASSLRLWGFRYVEDGPFGCWGQRERQAAMAKATGTHLAFMDDDDAYEEGAFEAIFQALERAPDAPHMFRMHPPAPAPTIWTEKVLRCGNVSGTQFVVPNVPGKLGAWGLRREGDWDFIESTLRLYEKGALVWDDAIIAGCRGQGVPARRGV